MSALRQRSWRGTGAFAGRVFVIVNELGDLGLAWLGRGDLRDAVKEAARCTSRLFCNERRRRLTPLYCMQMFGCGSPLSGNQALVVVIVA